MITSVEKLWMVGWLSAGAVAWGVVRSYWNSSGVNGAAGQVPETVSIAFFIILAFPVLVTFRSLDRLSWLLGAGVTVGLLPKVPLMPFAREGVHVVLLALALTMIIRCLAVPGRRPFSQPLRLYWSFVGVCSFSILCAQLIGSAGIWELKVGVAELILYAAFGLAVTRLCRAEELDGELPSLILDGLAWASLAQLVIMIGAIYLSIATPLVPGNDSLWGLGYWDRVKSTFAGPDNAGVFFTCMIPLMIYWGQRQVNRFPQLAAMAYIQLVPWLIMASGSRGARIAMLIVLGACLGSRQLRPRIVRALPSFIAASYVGFLFQSFPSALLALQMPILDRPLRVTGITLPTVGPDILGMSLQGRFFDDKARMTLFKECWEYFVAAPPIGMLIGSGLGVGGYRISGYPTAHNVFDLVIETGVIGFILLIRFAVFIVGRLSRLARATPRKDDGEDHLLAFPMLVALVVAILCSAIYELQTWGFVMAILAFTMVLTTDRSQGRCILMSRGRATKCVAS